MFKSEQAGLFCLQRYTPRDRQAHEAHTHPNNFRSRAARDAIPWQFSGCPDGTVKSAWVRYVGKAWRAHVASKEHKAGVEHFITIATLLRIVPKLLREGPEGKVQLVLRNVVAAVVTQLHKRPPNTPQPEQLVRFRLHAGRTVEKGQGDYRLTAVTSVCPPSQQPHGWLPEAAVTSFCKER